MFAVAGLVVPFLKGGRSRGERKERGRGRAREWKERQSRERVDMKRLGRQRMECERVEGVAGGLGERIQRECEAREAKTVRNQWKKAERETEQRENVRRGEGGEGKEGTGDEVESLDSIIANKNARYGLKSRFSRVYLCS